MDGYESRDEHKVPFPKENPAYLGEELENIRKESAFNVDPSSKITFKVG